MAQKWGVEINLGIFYFLFIFFWGGGQNFFFKWFTAHKNTCTYPIFYLFLWGGGTFSKKLGGGAKLFLDKKGGDGSQKKWGEEIDN